MQYLILHARAADSIYTPKQPINGGSWTSAAGGATATPHEIIVYRENNSHGTLIVHIFSPCLP